MLENNLISKLTEFTNSLQGWSHRKVTLMSKVTVVKMFAILKLIYPRTVLTPSEIVNAIHSEILNSIRTENLTK